MTDQHDVTDTPRKRLGELLLAEGKLSPADLERALEVQKSVGGRIGRLLIQLGLVSEADVYTALSLQTGIPLVRLDAFPATRPDWAGLNAAFLVAHHVLPLGDVRQDGPTPVFVTSDPQDSVLIEGLRIALGRRPELRLGLESEIAQRHNEWLEADHPPEEAAVGGAAGAAEFIEHLRDLASEAPIIRRVNEIVDKAVSLRASDIHIESYEDKSLVRARVDGDLVVYDEIDAKDVAAVVSRIKILSQLDIAERRLPQDGRTKLHIEEILRDLAASDPAWRIAILRYFNPVGAHESGLIGEDPNGIPNNLMPYVARVAAGRLPHLNIWGNDYPTVDGTGVRDYLHVMDLADGHRAALDHLGHTNQPCDTFNLGTGQGTSVLQMVRAFEQASGRPVPYRMAPRRLGDVAECWADPAKARRELGWQATRTLHDMCASAWGFACTTST